MKPEFTFDHIEAIFGGRHTAGDVRRLTAIANAIDFNIASFTHEMLMHADEIAFGLYRLNKPRLDEPERPRFSGPTPAMIRLRDAARDLVWSELPPVLRKVAGLESPSTQEAAK